MKFLNCAQGSAEWLQARAGKCTASCFIDAVSMVGALDERQARYVAEIGAGRSQSEAMTLAGYKAAPRSSIITRALAGEDTRVASDVARRYAADIAFEIISGQAHGEPPRAWVLDRGHIMEAQARMIYEARTKAFVTEAGLCVDESGFFAYSSDGLVEQDGLIEVKAPIDTIKILHILETGDVAEYMHQMQGGMWITGRKWCDFIMYVPELASVGKDLYVQRIHRDDAFIDAMALDLARFQRMVADYESILRLPYEPRIAPPPAPAPAAAPAANAPDWRKQFAKQS